MASENKEMADCYVCIDVECAAIGMGHFDLSPCRIAMVDYHGTVLFDEITKVPNITDPLIEFTGLTKEDINDKGIALKEALDKLHTLLSVMQSKYKNGITIIGQSPINDIVWVKLQKKKHYSRFIDLATMFRSGKYFYSLRRELNFKKRFKSPVGNFFQKTFLLYSFKN